MYTGTGTPRRAGLYQCHATPLRHMMMMLNVCVFKKTIIHVWLALGGSDHTRRIESSAIGRACGRRRPKRHTTCFCTGTVLFLCFLFFFLLLFCCSAELLFCSLLLVLKCSLLIERRKYFIQYIQQQYDRRTTCVRTGEYKIINRDTSFMILRKGSNTQESGLGNISRIRTTSLKKRE